MPHHRRTYDSNETSSQYFLHRGPPPLGLDMYNPRIGLSHPAPPPRGLPPGFPMAGVPSVRGVATYAQPIPPSLPPPPLPAVPHPYMFYAPAYAHQMPQAGQAQPYAYNPYGIPPPHVHNPQAVPVVQYPYLTQRPHPMEAVLEMPGPGEYPKPAQHSHRRRERRSSEPHHHRRHRSPSPAKDARARREAGIRNLEDELGHLQATFRDEAKLGSGTDRRLRLEDYATDIRRVKRDLEHAREAYEKSKQDTPRTRTSRPVAPRAPSPPKIEGSTRFHGQTRAHTASTPEAGPSQENALIRVQASSEGSQASSLSESFTIPRSQVSTILPSASISNVGRNHRR